MSDVALRQAIAYAIDPDTAGKTYIMDYNMEQTQLSFHSSKIFITKIKKDLIITQKKLRNY